MKIAKPILLNKNNILDLTKKTNFFLKETLYLPIAEIIKEQFNFDIKLNEINEKEFLLNELKNNKLFIDEKNIYSNKKYFSSKQSRILENLGARYNKIKKCFTFNILPSFLVDFVILRKTTLNKKIFSFNDFLDEYLKNIETSFNFFNVDFNKIVENYENQLKNNLKIFSIDAETKKYLNENFNKNYTENYKLNIKNFTEKNIKKLREKINKYILEEGLNYKKIADIIQENYSLSQRRSLFIARQETNLCLANYQKERYLNLGINEYKWKTADDEKVRNYPKNNKSGGNHKRLNNLIFSFDNPPITNELTGERHNPSEEYGCRCVAQPIIR